MGFESSKLGIAHVLLALLLLRTAEAQMPLESDKHYLTLFLQSLLTIPSPRFNFTTSPCQWTGVTCTGRHSHVRVRRIDLQNCGLNGSIPENTLSKLDALSHINLFNNSLSGPIPADLWMLSSLKHLNLSMNMLSGAFTFSGGLQVLDLSFNNFTGELLAAGFSNLFHLNTLILAKNAFQGTIPSSLSRLRFLQLLDLSKNSFTGSIPNLQGLKRLQTLNLSHNNLTGMVPPFLLQLPSQRFLSLRGNHFLGQLPALSNVSSLVILDFGRNSFTGIVPEEFWILPSLQILRLDHNHFSGALPDKLGAAMQRVELTNNYFEGNIAIILENWKGLEFLDLSSNKLTGSIITNNFNNWTAILHFGIADNNLSTSKFLSLREFLMLQFLNLSRINMHGVIPQNIGSLKSLRQLDLSHNLLHGMIPSSMRNLTSLLLLDLSYNNLSGPIPSQLSSLIALRHVNISYNNLSGSIPLKGFDSSSFAGNQGLCGPSLNRSCSAMVVSASRNRKNSNAFHRKFIVILTAVIGSFGGIAGIVGFLICCRRSKLIKKLPNKLEKNTSSSGPFSSEIDPGVWASGIPEPSSIPLVMFEKPLLNLTFADLLLSTSNFSKESQMADGNHGAVFQGVLPGGSHIAIKILVDKTPYSEDDAIRKLEAIGNLRHPNLVPLLGYCLIGVEKLILYKFINNGNLHSQLHDLPEGIQNTEDWSRDTWEQVEGEVPGEPRLTWPIRHKIALGTARALAFLHHGCCPHVVHLAVKSNNVLLGAEYEPHLADTGLSWLVAASSEIPTMGKDLGYAPPEYIHMKEATTKSDVYSFGVVLMELVTGKRPAGDYFEEGSHRGSLVPWVRCLVRDKHGIKALDPKLVNKGPVTEMLETLRIAYLCTAESPLKRPTMQQIVGLLKDLRPEQQQG
ncbi:hypothetical protein O6H91_21G057700 [Diphasiastrum complanatum]|uniref:Uncharacterized protein n=1 Tax=Diphasiastrum complanatum TaxID=34168 RepID=A0ACC2AKU8_DIPCM|nr:hypothetical protein O6H91_21G057700 [Diphasiastrum complanatum]